MFHTVAFYESLDGGGSLTEIASVQDRFITTNGDDVTIPRDLTNLAGAACLSAQTTLTSARIDSPSLRTLANFDIAPLVNAVVFGNPPEIADIFDNPQPLSANEDINFLINGDNTGAAANYGLAWLTDRNTAKQAGNIFTVRCTAAASLAAGSWASSNLTFTQTLPAGNYQVVGMRAESANLVAARLNFVGGRWAPGVPAVNAAGDIDLDRFRNGNVGVFGEFDETNPPTIECLGVTDTAQTIFLDLIKVG